MDIKGLDAAISRIAKWEKSEDKELLDALAFVKAHQADPAVAKLLISLTDKVEAVGKAIKDIKFPDPPVIPPIPEFPKYPEPKKVDFSGLIAILQDQHEVQQKNLLQLAKRLDTKNGPQKVIIANVEELAGGGPSETQGVRNPVKATAAAPSYSEGSYQPLSSDLAGRLRTTASVVFSGGTVDQGLPNTAANAWPVTLSHNLTTRMLAKEPQNGYSLWMDTGDINFIYILEAPSATGAGATGFQGIRMTKSATGSLVGKIQINTSATLTFNNRTTDPGWS